jgi:hypothetical protein
MSIPDEGYSRINYKLDIYVIIVFYLKFASNLFRGFKYNVHVSKKNRGPLGVCSISFALISFVFLFLGGGALYYTTEHNVVLI